MAKPCTKRRFSSRSGAEKRLEEIWDNPDPACMYLPTRAIYCSKCQGWHLTSKSGKVWRSGKTPRVA